MPSPLPILDPDPNETYYVVYAIDIPPAIGEDFEHPYKYVYIGSTNNFDRRMRTHARDLKVGSHGNSWMQNIFNKGEKATEWDRWGKRVLYYFDNEAAMVDCEQQLLDQVHGEPGFVNISKSADRPDLWGDPEYREKMSRNMSRRAKGQWRDPGHRENMSLRAKERWRDPEYRAIITRKIGERCQDPEYRENMSLRAKERWRDPGHRDYMAQKLEERWGDPKYRESMSRKTKSQWDDPEYRKKMQKPIVVSIVETGEELNFESTAQAAKFFGISAKTINSVLKGRSKTFSKKRYTARYLPKNSDSV